MRSLDYINPHQHCRTRVDPDVISNNGYAISTKVLAPETSSLVVVFFIRAVLKDVHKAQRMQQTV